MEVTQHVSKCYQANMHSLPFGKKKKKGRVIDGHELVMESIFGNTYIIPPPRNSFVALFSVGEFANKG